MSAVAIVGPSGTGKSTSYAHFPELGIKGLNPKETVIINVGKKDLPMRGWKNLYKGNVSEGGNYFESSNATDISKAIDYISSKRPDITNMVIDDAQQIMAFEFMARAKEPGYGKFTDIGVNISKVMVSARECRKSLRVFFLWHPDIDKDGKMSMKTVGKMVNDYLTLEGLFTVVLYSRVNNVENKIFYEFITNNDGIFPAKSPYGMFDRMYIKNDLGYVADKVGEYDQGETEEVKEPKKKDILEV